MKMYRLISLLFLLSGAVCLPAIDISATNSAERKSGNESQIVLGPKSVLEDLPLKIMASSVDTNLPMLVFITGDGGWNNFEESLCRCLNQKGVPVVALNAQKYFWKSKTPDETTAALTAIVAAYQKIWKRDSFVLAGFSFGASIVPFLVNRLSSDVARQLLVYLMISPDETCDFEIHLSDMLNLGISKGGFDVMKEIQTGKFKRITAIFGSDENEEVRKLFQQSGLTVEILEGDHHFNSGYQALADLIVTEMKRE